MTQKTPTTDEELMAEVAGGRMEALEELFARYRRPVASLCFRFLRDRDKAESAAQETFMRLLQHREKYQEGHKFSTWILSIAANLCRDQLKRKDRSTLDGLDDMNLQLIDRTDSPTDGAEQAEMTALLTAAVDRLEPIYQEIVVLRIFQDLSYKEISDLTGCNESTARSRMELAVKQLRRLLSVRKTGRASAKRTAGGTA